VASACRTSTCSMDLSPPVQASVTPGHEAFGTVVQTGELAEGWAKGDRVVLAGGQNCGTCQRCRSGRFDACQAPQIMGFSYDGAWAEYVLVGAHTLSTVPEGIVAEQAAILADAVATPFAALVDRGALRPGESVGLWGIGGLGTHAVQLARLMGASVVVAVDPLEGARRRALACGADVALDPSDPALSDQVMQATGGLGLDLALDLVGSNAVLQQAEAALGRGGRLVMVGVSLEPIQLGPQFPVRAAVSCPDGSSWLPEAPSGCAGAPAGKWAAGPLGVDYGRYPPLRHRRRRSAPFDEGRRPRSDRCPTVGCSQRFESATPRNVMSGVAGLRFGASAM
jgi:D-arabinose 1-dehydrogenase-like Zn-dependent alcohol dehydrogenase